MAYEFYLGLHLNDDDGSATLALLEKEVDDAAGTPVYHLRMLEQTDGKAVDDDLVERVGDLLADKPYTGRALTVVDRSSRAGQKLLDALAKAGMTPLGVTVSDGGSAAQSGSGLTGAGSNDAESGGFIISRRALAESLQELYRSGQLETAQHDSAAASALIEKLHREDTPPTDGDDVIYSVSLACWVGEQRAFDPTEHLEGPPPPTGQPEPTNP